MLDSLEINGHRYKFDAARPIDISIPLRFNGPQPNAFGVEPATSVPCVAGDLVGDTRRGGSCNFERYTFIPHCSGTHTECVGHITHERISIRDCLRDVFVPAQLVSVAPEAAEETAESYSRRIETGDVVITTRSLQSIRAASALIIRVLPNDEGKPTRRYVEDIPAYFTTEAIEHIVESGIEHLIVDLPSIDRLHDDGRLSNHRVFWKVGPGSFELSEIARRHCTITELAFIANDIEDGQYLLNLQIAPFAADASPSRPLLFRVEEN